MMAAMDYAGASPALEGSHKVWTTQIESCSCPCAAVHYEAEYRVLLCLLQ
jgi:hypothetical protein